MLKNSPQTYGLISVSLHWLMAVLILILFFLGIYMVDLDYYSPWYTTAPHLHESLGVLMFALLIFRFIWRQINVQPLLSGKTWEKIAAKITHRSHYFLMFILAVSGYLIPTAKGEGIDVFNWFTVSSLNWLFGGNEYDTTLIGEIHEIGAWALMALVALHTGAALKHHILDRDDTLKRMLGIVK